LDLRKKMLIADMIIANGEKRNAYVDYSVAVLSILLGSTLEHKRCY
jgi:hypothetical protein